MNVTTAMSKLGLPTLTKAMVAVLSLPHSNADCERSFSVVRKIHTGYRQTMNSDTLTAQLPCKMNVDTVCHQFVVTDDMVTLANVPLWNITLLTSELHQ